MASSSSSFSLRDLLSRESSRRFSSPPRLCSDAGRSSDRRRHCAPAAIPSGRNSNSASKSNRSAGSIPRSLPPPKVDVDENDDGDPAAGEAALRAVVAILAGYVGRFLRDAAFRRRLREKCAACIAAASRGPTHAVLANLELGIESIERLADEGPNAGEAGTAATAGPHRDSKIRSLRNSIRLLSVVASLNSSKSRGAGGYTCGVPNSHLSACAQFYLAVVYKIERNDRVSVKHLLQVFADAPYLARRNLLPDLWGHLILPHLLHLKVWYSKEVELVSEWEVEDRNQRVKMLNRAYNDQMDVGTAQFALYYKEWLKVGGKAPPTPAVPLPSRPSYLEAWGKRSVSSASRSSINRSLYQAVFGPSPRPDGIEDGLLTEDLRSASQRELDINEATCKLSKLAHNDRGFSQRGLHNSKDHATDDAASEPRRSNSFRLLVCHSTPDAAAVRHVKTSKKESTIISRETENGAPSTNLGGVIGLISGSHNLKECEAAVHAIAKALLVSDGDAAVMRILSKSSVIEGLLEVTFTSKDEHVLELSISILAELVTRNEINRQLILNVDPQLEIFLRLFKNDNLFLKAAVVLYLLRPKAKQMLSLDWIPLVLRVLEYEGQIQTLFTVKCSPKSAAFYFLDQLLMGFDVDRNVENAKQLIVLGGLDLLIRELEIGDTHERKSSASFLARCIRADGSCRQYLAASIKKSSVIHLLGDQLKSSGTAISLLNELVCLNRTTMIVKFLKELKHDGCLNIMHVLLVYVQQAPLEQRPLAATLLILLDLLGDPLQYSTYREEAVDALVGVLEHNLHRKKVQEQCNRALMLLGGRFSHIGEPTSEKWLLKRARASVSPSDSYRSKEIVITEETRSEEEEKALQDWLRKLSIILLRSGSRRLLVALSNCIADGIPSLARSCLVTVAWMTSSLSSIHNADNLQALACSILAPRLFESLSYDRPQEERVLASLSLFNFTRHPECLPKLFPLDKETTRSLQDLAQVTWTAKEVLFACCG